MIPPAMNSDTTMTKVRFWRPTMRLIHDASSASRASPMISGVIRTNAIRSSILATASCGTALMAAYRFMARWGHGTGRIINESAGQRDRMTAPTPYARYAALLAFLRSQTAGGLALIAAAAVALVWSN